MTGIEEIPTESEWQIMEVLWNHKTPMTSKAVIMELQKTNTMKPKMVRVLMNRLCEKGLLAYTVDSNDKRVYHYSVLRTREECLKEKTRRFTNSYFSGNTKVAAENAMAALIQSFDLTNEQIEELEGILKKSRERKKE